MTIDEKLLLIRQRIDALLGQDQVLLAIDGKCASGKTTIATRLAEIYGCNLFHMDDFFLRVEQRTPDRYAQTGGNVDYERFYEEVLLPLRSGAAFSYRPFDCKTFAFSAPIHVPVKQLNIIEGSYSMHPYFGDPYDLKILLHVDAQLQHQRIQNRPAHLQSRFFREWIPMENRYLEEFRIAERADILL